MKLLPSDVENLAGTDSGRRHLSHSRISVLLACPRKYSLDYVEELELAARPVYMTLGSAFQRGIEEGDPEAGVLALHLHPDLGPPTSQEEEDQRRVNETIVRSACELYLRRWPLEQGATEAREVDFLVRLRNPETGHYSLTFDLKGRADGVIDNALPWAPMRDGDQMALRQPLELVENKLTGQITPMKVRHLPLDQQVALMRYGLWRATGRPVTTVHYRWVKRPSIRQKQSETIDQFCERLAQDYIDRPEFYSHAEDYYASTDDLLRIEAELWRIAEMLRVQERSLYVRNTNHCMNFGGCQYMPICSGDPDAMSLYQQKTTTDDRRPEGETVAT